MQGIEKDAGFKRERMAMRHKAARDGALLGFFIGGTIAVLCLACYAMASLEDPRAVAAVWFIWWFLILNFWWANSPFYQLYKTWRSNHLIRKDI